MFLVSGTKRSGTSMWMQVLLAAGLDILGEPFSRTWGNGPIRAANPHGFYESHFRDGIFFGTNPDPITARYLRPEETRDTVVKVFVPGVVRTELAFISGVIANIRDWREHEASHQRLQRLENEHRLAEAPGEPEPERLPAHLEWWVENFTLIRDQAIRGYPLLLQSYASMRRDPEPFVRRALALVGRSGVDVAAAVRAVEPGSPTTRSASSDSVEPRIAGVFDALFAAIDQGEAPSPSLRRLLAATHRELQPRIAEWRIQNARRRLLEGAHPSPALMLGVDLA